ncbi:MAG: hypothetical protein J7J31_09460 [Helicobacteraceae bacterium]|nr:hypothetical protein [Helicobacteraceae bacterium]
MRLPKGFGKNYFTLRAITATVNQISLDATSTRSKEFHLLRHTSQELDALEEEEELATTLCAPILSIKPCHCNCYFLRITKKILTLCPNQKHFYNYFKTLNSAISPPLFTSLLYSQKNKILRKIYQ